MTTKERHPTGGLAQAGHFLARKYVQICKCVAPPALAKLPARYRQAWDKTAATKHKKGNE